MLSPNELEKFPKDIVKLAENMQKWVVRKISYSLGELSSYSSLEEYNLYRVAMINRFAEEYRKKLLQYTLAMDQKTAKAITNLVSSNIINNKMADISSITYLPFEDDLFLSSLADNAVFDAQQDIADAMSALGFSQKINGRMQFTPIEPADFQGLNKSAGYYQKVLDTTANYIYSGDIDYNTAIRMAVNTMTDYGMRTYNQRNGNTERIDTAIRRSVMRQVKNITQVQTEYQATKLGLTIFEISWHEGHRPSHGWGGRRYSTVRTDEVDPQTGKKYLLKEQLFERYGGGTLDDWNCYHDINYVLPNDAPMFSIERLNRLEEEETREKEYAGKKLNKYDARQRQRALERSMRKWRLKADGYKMAKQTKDYEVAKAKYMLYRQQYKAFSSAMNLRTEFERVYYDGLGRT